MPTAGAVTEFNPFHSGHAYFLNSLRSGGADAVVCVMSGTFVQRGTPAVMLPAARAKAALKNGADLVLELPLPWAMARAERFAHGGVAVLEACGVCDTLGFGSECGDVSLIKGVSEVLAGEQFRGLLKAELARGISFAAARESAAAALCPGAGAVLSSPNDTLACEYLAALRDCNSSMAACCVKRSGAAHDGPAEGSSASASAIREALAAGESVTRFMPRSAYNSLRGEITEGRAPADPDLLDKIILYKLRMTTSAELSCLPDVSEGLSDRIAFAVSEASSTQELISLAKSKRYSYARIRRIIMSAVLGLTEDDAAGMPPYIRVLGFNSAGRKLLRKMKTSASLPVVMKYSDVRSLDSRAQHIFDLQCRAADVFSLCLPAPLHCGIEQRMSPVVLF